MFGLLNLEVNMHHAIGTMSIVYELKYYCVDGKARNTNELLNVLTQGQWAALEWHTARYSFSCEKNHLMKTKKNVIRSEENSI